MDEINDYAWIVAHEGTCIHIEEDNSWNLMVKSRCSHLDFKGDCKVYSKRPNICRQHDPEACEHKSSTDHDYDNVTRVLTTLDDVFEIGDELFANSDDDS